LAKELVSPVRTGTIDLGSEGVEKFPFDAFEFDAPSSAAPILTLRSPWKLAAASWVSGTAAALATLNAIVPLGQIAFETDTISIKIGDGTTAYNSLTYVYRGLPIPSEPSLGTPHPTSDANRSSSAMVNTSTNTAGIWSGAVTMTGVPTGAKAAYCTCYIQLAGQTPYMCVEAASGYTLSDITVGTNYLKYFSLKTPASGIGGLVTIKIHLDSNKQFKWCTSNTNSTVLIGSAIDYDM
jgi:hypothetical protein